MDISQYAVDAESVDALAAFQIADFFHNHASMTRDECDRVAAGIVGGPVSTTPVQGAASYTVAPCSNERPKVVQFRNSVLDTGLIDQA